MKDLTRLLERKPAERIDSAEARSFWMDWRLASGYRTYRPLFTDQSENAKFAKTTEARLMGLALSAADRSDEFNACRFSTPLCRAHCVGDAGNGRWASVFVARSAKTRFVAAHPDAAATILSDEIAKGRARWGNIAVRLNTFSDLRWELTAPFIFDENPDVPFFDYSKIPMDQRFPAANYHLTWSASELTTDDQIKATVDGGTNVAVVFSTAKTKPLPSDYLGYPVVDGDKSDARYLDPSGVIVGLRAKGSMRKNPGGFVRDGAFPHAKVYA